MSENWVTSCSFNAFCKVIRVFFPSITTSYVIPKLIGCVSRTLVRFQHTLAKLTKSVQFSAMVSNNFWRCILISKYLRFIEVFMYSFISFSFSWESSSNRGSWAKKYPYDDIMKRHIKFIYSEKATKIWKNLLHWRY